MGAVAVASASIGAPREAVPRWLALLGLSCSALAIAGLLAARLPKRQLVVATLGGAALLRLAAVCTPVSLSDDVHRYVWDGALGAAGLDPFAHRPRDVVGQAPGLGRARFERLNSPDYYTVYPPVAQLAFAAAATTEPALDGTVSLRAIFALADLFGVLALFALLDRLGRAPGWALLYAWNPLVYWELASGGHTEALLVPLLLAAAVVAMDGRALGVGILLGLAAAAKITALAVVPLFVVYLATRRGLGRALGAGGVAGAVLGLTFLPFASDTLVPHLRESLSLFSGRFSFNAPVYYALRDGMGYVEGFRPSVDPDLMPWLAVATLLWLALMVFLQDGSRARFVGGVAFTFVGLMVFARVVHPWYLVPALAFGVAARSPSIVLASVLLPLSYLRYHPFGREEPWVIAVEFVPVFAVLLLETALRMTRTPARREASEAPALVPAQGRTSHP
ncbi:MAG: glycosyltransferase 87 family protein [Sandaracinaceae bacterium]